MEGWICLHRKILENPIICKDSDYFTVWCYLLLTATHKDKNILFIHTGGTPLFYDDLEKF